MQEIVVAAAILEEDGTFLIARRPRGKPFPGKWEFPGGKVEIQETPESCLMRELEEELGIKVAVGEFVAEGVFQDEKITIRVLGYRATRLHGEVKANVHDEIGWVPASEFSRFDFAPADVSIAETLSPPQ